MSACLLRRLLPLEKDKYRRPSPRFNNILIQTTNKHVYTLHHQLQQPSIKMFASKIVASLGLFLGLATATVNVGKDSAGDTGKDSSSLLSSHLSFK
jgi:hypothetical protein